MTTSIVTVAGTPMAVHAVNTLVVGSGAAALNAAVSLHDRGQRDIAIVTEAWGGGTSANAGSDKQTYYKLSLSGSVPDAPRLLAEDLFAGGCMHGDIALCEAQHSAQAFHHLVQLGVPFPHDRYGGFAGYRTDHDQRGRATSAGPLTSRLMVERLSDAVRARGIPVLEPVQIVALLTDERRDAPRIAGAMGLDVASCRRGEPRFVLFGATSVILGTGGPGGMYLDSVYPVEQTGSIGIALRVGAVAQNLTESQFGLASIGHRWNVSGSYQQVIPRYVSTDAGGNDPQEFLAPAFPDVASLGTAIFRKGYQWPFDPRRIRGGGSSLIDLLVYRERVERGRRVWLDFTGNIGSPDGFDIAHLHDEAREYLERCGATGATPIDRLAAMNPPAIELYRSFGIDLARDRLEISVCAQHNNGGLRGDIWWESNVEGLFPVGEVNGSHGIRRPGGASLNAGQTGGLRAALRIAQKRRGLPLDAEALAAQCGRTIAGTLELARRMLTNDRPDRLGASSLLLDVQQRMSRAGGHVREIGVAGPAAAEAWALEARAADLCWAQSASDLPAAFRALDLCTAHAVYLDAVVEYLRRGGQSRGSFLVMDPAGEPLTAGGGGELCRFTLDAPDSFVARHILELSLAPGGGTARAWVPVRPIPETDGWFESVWKAFREGSVFD